MAMVVVREVCPNGELAPNIVYLSADTWTPASLMGEMLGIRDWANSTTVVHNEIIAYYPDMDEDDWETFEEEFPDSHPRWADPDPDTANTVMEDDT